MTAHNVENITHLLSAYISLWNDRNPHTRQATGAEIFTPDAGYVDPNADAQGRSEIDSYVAGWQEQFANMIFVLGEVRSHHDVAHFDWSFGPPGGTPVANGWDVAVIEQGRISQIYGFFG